MIRLSPCPKRCTRDLDKAVAPEETLQRVRARLETLNMDILARTRRIDTGRLGIPVYLSVCGEEARRVLPTRKQMGKGASPAQAETSALMELMERYAFFTFWERRPEVVEATWSEAEARFGDALIPLQDILFSVRDPLPEAEARRILDLVRWQFFPATCLTTMRKVWLPLDWFKKLGEFNGTSAGNSEEESLLQGLCELVERHVCCIIDRERRVTPTIAPESVTDPVLRGLLDAFAREGITLILKDFSLGMPVPTVGALAMDPSTFPERSEIVFTAGTASSPTKAAIRAVTEVAQLAGDFCTGACYEASGLPKFDAWENTAWLRYGPVLPLSALPTLEAPDILNELTALVRRLNGRGYNAYAVSTMHPELRIPAHYSLIPGFAFRERDKNQSLGLFVGRILTEEADLPTAERGLALLEEILPEAHFLPFFRGMLALRHDDIAGARALFEQSEPLQPEADARGLAAFYTAYAHTLENAWAEAVPALTRAVALCPEMKEYWNLRGVAHFKTGNYAAGAEDFAAALRLDKGSALDWANLGVCRKFLGETEEALAALETALSIDPSLDFARAHLEELGRA